MDQRAYYGEDYTLVTDSRLSRPRGKTETRHDATPTRSSSSTPLSSRPWNAPPAPSGGSQPTSTDRVGSGRVQVKYNPPEPINRGSLRKLPSYHQKARPEGSKGESRVTIQLHYPWERISVAPYRRSNIYLPTYLYLCLSS